MSQAGSPITFSPTAFRGYYPQFANATTYPDAALDSWFWQASQFVSTTPMSNWAMLTGLAQLYALNLFTAHIGAIAALITSGQTPAFETSAAIDKIRVTVQPPPNPTQFAWWLNLTPYGQQLAAMLATKTAGGFYTGGSPTRFGFRNAGGGWG
jgi:hypothetical protein